MTSPIAASSTASAAGCSQPMRSVPLMVSLAPGTSTTGGAGGAFLSQPKSARHPRTIHDRVTALG
jgi:hypothetical protein